MNQEQFNALLATVREQVLTEVKNGVRDEFDAMKTQIQTLQGQLEQAHAEVAAATSGSGGPSYKVKIEPPKKFNGSRVTSDVLAFEIGAKNYFERLKQKGVSDAELLSMVPDILSGRALIWHEGSKQYIIGNATHHIDAVKKRFLATNIVEKARHDILQLKMQNMKDYEKYLEKFMELACLIPDLSTSEKLEKFRNGLIGDYLKDVLRDNCQTFEAAVASCDRTSIYLGQISAIRGFTNGQPSEDTTPMEVDNIEKSKYRGRKKSDSATSRVKVDLSTFQPEVLGKLMQEGRCLNCGKTGHRYTFCKNEKKDFQQL